MNKLQMLREIEKLQKENRALNTTEIPVEVRKRATIETYEENGITVTRYPAKGYKSSNGRKAKGQRAQELQRQYGLPGYVSRAA